MLSSLHLLANIENHLTFKEIYHLGLTSKACYRFAEQLRTQKIHNSMGFHSVPLNKLTGSLSPQPILEMLSRVSIISREKILGVNLSEMSTIDKTSLLEIIALCPKLARLQFHPQTHLPVPLLAQILAQRSLQSLELTITSPDQIPFEYRHKITGITVHLAFAYEHSLLEAMNFLKEAFQNLTNLTIQTRNVIKLPPVSDSIRRLICKNSSIRSFAYLPPHLEFLDCSGCPLTEVPAVPKGCILKQLQIED